MNIFKSVLNFIGTHKLITLIFLIIVIGGGYYWRSSHKGSSTNQFQTASVTRGTLVQTVTASGQIASVNSVAINTTATGVVKTVNVKNGDQVNQGEVIATLTLDQTSQQKQVAAYSSLLSAENTLAADKSDWNTLQNTEFTANQKFMNDAVERGLTATDPTYIEENAAWLAAESAYQNQASVISQAEAAVTSAQLAYQQISSTITSPASGTVAGLTITPGTPITTSTTSSGTVSPEAVGNVTQPGPIQASVDISEIDSVNVEVGQKATLTLDAFPNETFTGKVLSIDTSGVVSSGVTTYPAVIAFDNSVPHIYPNMAVNATIITGIKNNVLLVPSIAIQTQNGQSTVRVLKNGQVQTVSVSIGAANDTETEITSGLSEGDNVITSFQTTQGAGGSSPFGLNRGGPGGGRVFRIGGG